MKKTILLFAFLSITLGFAQQNLNEYKYIIVPKKFEFLKTADEYRLNALTKFLFEKYNFKAIMEGETLPNDYAKDICLGLKANVLKESNFFRTKLSVQLTNCKNEIIFTTKPGDSREKNYKKAYNEALRMAFNSFKAVNYSYNNTVKETIEVEEKQPEIKNSRVVANAKIKERVTKTPIPKPEKNYNILYAQKIANGFQLVDNTPKIIFKIKKTGLFNVFLVEEKNAILYKLDANWILEYYENNTLRTKIINIQF